MPQTGLHDPPKPFFVLWAEVKAGDRIEVTCHGEKSSVFWGTCGVTGELGVEYGHGPKDWSPRQRKDRIILLYVKGGRYLSLKVDQQWLLLNSLSLYGGRVVLLPSGGAGPPRPPVSRASRGKGNPWAPPTGSGHFPG